MAIPSIPDTIELLEKAIDTWCGKLQEVQDIITISPEAYRGGGPWNLVNSLYNVSEAVGLSLLVLCFFIGMIQTASNLAETKRPEVAVMAFARIGITGFFVSNAQTIMLKIMNIFQSLAGDFNASIVSPIIKGALAGFGESPGTVPVYNVPQEIIDAVNKLSWFDGLKVWIVTFIGGLAITVAALIIILTVYARFFKLYMYIILSPIPLATFSGKPTSQVGMSFLKSFCGVGLEAAIIAIAIGLYSSFTSSPVVTGTGAVEMVWNYMLDTIFNMLILVIIIKTAPTIVRDMLGV